MRESKLSLNICTNHNVVIDHGTYNTKAGFSTQDNPSTILSSIVGHGRHKGAMKALGLKDTYVGTQAQDLRGILAISNPIKQGVVQDWDDLEAIWDHIWLKELQASPSDLPALLTHPPPSNSGDWNKMAEILMEKLEVPALYLANKSVMALYGGGQMTGISVDSGHDTTYIVPSYQGNPIQEATLTLRLGGKQVTEQLMNLLLNGKYSFPDDNFLLWRKKKKSKFNVTSKMEIIREMKEQHSYISTNYQKEIVEDTFPEKSIRLPDGNMIVMGKESIQAPEIMFQPGLAMKKSCGLHELVYYSLMKCDEKLRPELLANITLSGGNTKFPGMEKRLYSELVKLLPDKTSVRVRALPNRELLGWIGGARLSNLSSFQRFWVTKADYRENGGSVFQQDSTRLFDTNNGNSNMPTNNGNSQPLSTTVELVDNNHS